MRVYGALMWSLGKVLNTPEVVRVYIGYEELIILLPSSSFLFVPRFVVIFSSVRAPLSFGLYSKFCPGKRCLEVLGIALGHLNHFLLCFTSYIHKRWLELLVSIQFISFFVTLKDFLVCQLISFFKKILDLQIVQWQTSKRSGCWSNWEGAVWERTRWSPFRFERHS